MLFYWRLLVEWAGILSYNVSSGIRWGWVVDYADGLSKPLIVQSDHMKIGTFDIEKITWKGAFSSLRFAFLTSMRSLLVFCLFFALSFGIVDCLYAQTRVQSSGGDVSPSGGALFVPSRDVNSSTHFSTVDAARRNRPPEPSKSREDLFYPDGFLTLSSPTPESSTASMAANVDTTSRKIGTEDRGVQLRPLDPSVETTPVTVGQPQMTEKVSTKKRRDRFFFFAVSVALAGLGFFVYNEFRYREQLRADLVRNARLCSPNATAADFESILAADLDLTDPRAPSYVNPRYDADVLMFDDPDPLGKTLKDPDFDGFHFEASEGELNHQGPGLGEENFDFMPEGKSVILNSEPTEDFIVGGGLVSYDDRNNLVESSKL